MRPFFLFIAFVFSFSAFAQSETQLLEEAKARNINSKEEALNALTEEGISENQARQLARMRGVDFDTLYYQSDTYLLGRDVVKDGLERGIFFK